MQVTLVDCPGHASLIRTIIGGAQIIDAMLLVIDITKGIQVKPAITALLRVEPILTVSLLLQAQTAECLVVGEIAVARMTVVLNKCDLVRGHCCLRAWSCGSAVRRP